MEANLNTSPNAFEPSELILNPDGSIYHLKLKPEHIANTIIVVGDQSRVARVSSYFSEIEYKIENREFITHTGYYKNKRITVMSTGIGADNLDIAINELDALVNIDLNTKKIKPKHTSLNIVRIGTSGSIQPDIPVDSYLLSTHGLGFDGLLGFYDYTQNTEEIEIQKEFFNQINWNITTINPYIAKGSEKLISLLQEKAQKGITITGNGFYGPQGRVLRIQTKQPNLNSQLQKFRYKSLKITNFEMETSALYSLSAILGHHAATICAIIANRDTKEYSKNYKLTIDKLIQYVLNKIS